MIRAAALMCVVLSVFTAAGCGRHERIDPIQSAETSGKPLDGDFTKSSDPGTLIAARSLPDVDSSLLGVTSLAARITYTSTSGVDDGKRPVSGAVFAPKGIPPEGGWPVVAFGHPTTGIQPECAPSLSPTLLGSLTMVTELVKAGYVVTVSDYLGLGLRDTYHPYLDSTTVGYNLIDSVRAARKLVPGTSNRWVALGADQGGQAAWAANELADTYGWGLKILGSVSWSPLADVNGFADAAAAGQLTKDQELALQAFLVSLKNEYDDFNLDDYRRGIVREKWDVLSACQGSAVDERVMVADEMTSDDLRPGSSEAVETLRGFLGKTNLPQGPAAAPMLVIYGGEDSLIPRSWTDRALDRACTMGDVIGIETQPDDIDVLSTLGWMSERFRGVPAPNDCPSFTTAYESSGQSG